MYRQLTSLGSIFQWTTFFFPWLLLIIFTSFVIFVYSLLKSFNRRKIICKQIFTVLSLKFLLRKFLILESIQRFRMDLLSIYKEEVKSAEIFSSSTIFIAQFELEPKGELLYRYQQFLELNGCNLLGSLEIWKSIHKWSFTCLKSILNISHTNYL